MIKVIEKENAPSVEEIFTKVINESGIKAKDNGKYYLYINDNYRRQQVCKNFTTLQDAVKIARIMHSELHKVSHLIYAKVTARTVDINKYCFRADDWTTLFEIDNYGNEKIKHRDTIKAVAEIENRTVEEVTGDIGRSTEDYGIYHSTAKFEEIPTIKVKSASDADKLVQMPMFNGITRKKIDNGENLTYKDKTVRLEIDDKIGNFFDYEYILYAEKIHRKLDLLPVIKSELDDYNDGFFENGAKSVLSILVKINGLDAIYYGYGFGGDFHEYDEKLLHINVERNKHSLADRDDDEFKTYKSRKKMNEALAKYGLTFEQIEQFFANEELKLTIDDYIVDADAAAEVEIANAKLTELEYFENIEAKADILKAKIAEQKKNRKPIIDWKATFEDMRISEILDLQKDFKKFLKLGETDLAENVFSMLKTLCRNYRAAA